MLPRKSALCNTKALSADGISDVIAAVIFLVLVLALIASVLLPKALSAKDTGDKSNKVINTINSGISSITPP